MSNPYIRPVRQTDRPEWLRLRLLLWPDCPEGEQIAEMEGYLRNPVGTVFVAERPGGGVNYLTTTRLRSSKHFSP